MKKHSWFKSQQGLYYKALTQLLELKRDFLFHLAIIHSLKLVEVLHADWKTGQICWYQQEVSDQQTHFHEKFVLVDPPRAAQEEVKFCPAEVFSVEANISPVVWSRTQQ